MADDEGDKRVTKIGGTMIIDHGDGTPPQGIYAVTTLTQAQLAAVRARIRTFRNALRAKKEVPAFARAVRWVYKVYSYDVNLDSDFVPNPTYGVTFEAFTEFVVRKEIDAEAEEIVEEEDDAPHSH
jgi:hypothetical protein